METPCRRIETLDDLRTYVNQTLCEHEQLELGAFRMTERILVRNGIPCGVYFCLHGPRAVMFSAIWETDRNTILFYRATGERYLKTCLVHSPRVFASPLDKRPSPRSARRAASHLHSTS